MNHHPLVRNDFLPGSCRGSMIVELLACGALLGVVLSTAIPMLRWAIQERKFTDEREIAMLEVDNLMERVTALDWSELTTERAAEFGLSTSVAAQLPEPHLAIAVESDAKDDAAKIVRINPTLEPKHVHPPGPPKCAGGLGLSTRDEGRTAERAAPK